jgi:hypothetical protein
MTNKPLPKNKNTMGPLGLTPPHPAIPARQTKTEINVTKRRGKQNRSKPTKSRRKPKIPMLSKDANVVAKRKKKMHNCMCEKVKKQMHNSV